MKRKCSRIGRNILRRQIKLLAQKLSGKVWGGQNVRLMLAFLRLNQNGGRKDPQRCKTAETTTAIQDRRIRQGLNIIIKASHMK